MKNLFAVNFAENTILDFKGTGVELKIGGENASVFIEHNQVSFCVYYCIYIVSWQ